ncbi:MAG: putative Ig domain-containing protein, partial [Poseidonia sp.]
SNGTIWGTPTELWNTTAYTVWANNTGGSSVAYLNITVIDQLPTSVAYTPENLTLTRGELSSDLPLAPALTGPGDITSWAINASLPTGLSFGTNNGTIWGVPQVNMTTTTYTIWANNTGGSVSTTLNITVLEPMVILDYNPENLTLIRGVQMATLFPSVSGGNVSNWSISPDLPAGLNFSDGVISGTPTVNMTLSIFTVWANTSGGAASHTVNITILEPSGNLSYSPNNITLTRGVAMSDLHPTYSGGSIENWSIHPALPAGLNFSNGVISGTPTVNLTTSMFTVYANNTGGSAAATINITILEPVVDLLYNPNNLTLMRGTTMQPLHPTVSGGNVSEWALVGVLPEGLNFSNGVFSGTPLVNMTQTQYLVYANTSGGSATAWVNITVLEPAVDLSYNPYNITLIRNDTMNPLSPTVSGGNVSNWSIFPELPAGLNFTNGTISGTPEVNMTTTMFTVWANTSGGASSTTVNITILEPVVDFIYNPNSLVLTRNESMNATSPVFGNDALAEEWGISPALPEGLNFTNGTISGTPLVNLTATVFTVFANNSGGTGVAYLTITVLEPVATVVYVPENITLTRGEDNASIVPILGGGMVASWSISPDLPEGMVFDNGSITGVPLVNSTNTTYTVMALNSGGMAFAFLNITVVEPVAVLAFNESFLGTRGETLFNATVNNTGGMVATWAIEPALPEGVGLWNGWLYGTPSVNLSETTFTIWANNSGGSANITFTLEVIEPVVIIDYPEADIVLVNGVTRGRIIPILSGGVADNWSIEPALPPGLTFLNGYIIGVAATNLSQTTYTVWANNSGGSASATFNLTVNQPTYYARYPATRVVLDINETMPTLTPIYYFGDNQNPVWSIAPTLPEGLAFENGRISGTPTEVSNETNYTITVLGEMVPVELYVIIEVRAEANNTVESVRNETEVEQFVLPEPPEPESFDMYWLCFPLLLLLTLLGVAAINNFLALVKDDEEEEEPENEGKDDGDGGGD